MGMASAGVWLHLPIGALEQELQYPVDLTMRQWGQTFILYHLSLALGFGYQRESVSARLGQF
jgi:hypothetical protein